MRGRSGLRMRARSMLQQDAWPRRIACVHGSVHHKFSRLVMPALLSLPACDTMPALSADWLRQNNAVSLAEAMCAFAHWLEGMQAPILFLAHDAFRSDQLLFRSAMATTGIILHMPHFWMDSIHFCRYAFRSHRLESYCLASLCQRFLNETTKHRACSDAVNLSRIMNIAETHIPFAGYVIPTHETALTLVPGIGIGTIHQFAHKQIPDTATGITYYILAGKEVPLSQSVKAALNKFLRTRCEQYCVYASESSTSSDGGTSTM